MSNPYKFADLPPIKPCPFCFSYQTVLGNAETNYFVECSICGAVGPEYDDSEKAIKQWNGPTNDIDHLRADCERLRRELDECNGVIR